MFGTWKLDLKADSRFGDPIYNTMAMVAASYGPNYIKCQVSRLDTVDYSGRVYVVVNLMGIYIKIYEWSEGAPSVYSLKTPDTVSMFKFEPTRLSFKRYVIIPNTSTMILSNEKYTLSKYEIVKHTIESTLRTQLEYDQLWTFSSV